VGGCTAGDVFLELCVLSVKQLYDMLCMRLEVFMVVHCDCPLNGVELSYEISDEVQDTHLTVISLTYFV
jgi:hypothetical protein